MIAVITYTSLGSMKYIHCWTQEEFDKAMAEVRELERMHVAHRVHAYECMEMAPEELEARAIALPVGWPNHAPEEWDFSVSDRT